MFDFWGDGWCWVGVCGVVIISDVLGNVIFSAGVLFGVVFVIVDFVLGFVFCGILGCIDSIVANYDLLVTIDDGLCTYCIDI